MRTSVDFRVLSVIAILGLQASCSKRTDIWSVDWITEDDEEWEEHYPLTDEDRRRIYGWLETGIEIEWPEDCPRYIKGKLDGKAIRLVDTRLEYGVIRFGHKHFRIESNVALNRLAHEIWGRPSKRVQHPGSRPPDLPPD